MSFSVLIVFTLFSAQSLSYEQTKEGEISGMETSESNKFVMQDQICNTNECKKIGQEFLLLINQTVNPCNDFYEFVCGKYSREMKIPNDMISVSTFSEANEKVIQILRKQLDQPSREGEPLSVTYATNMYQGCLDSASLQSRGVYPLLNGITRIGGWPLIKGVFPFDESHYDLFDALAKLNGLYGESPIIDISLIGDPKDSSRNLLYLGSAIPVNLETTLLDKFKKENRSRTVRFPPPVYEVRNRTLQHQTRQALLDYTSKYILQIVLTMGGKNDIQTLKQIDDIIEFSSKLEQIQTPDLDFKSIFNKMTIRQLIELTSNKIDWLQFLNQISALSDSKHRFTYDEIVIVSDLGYFKKLPNLLSSTSNIVLANVLGLYLVNDFGVYTVDAFRELDYERLQMIYNVTEPSTNWKFCLSLVRSAMGFAISAKYVAQNFKMKSKTMVTQLVKYIKLSLHELFENNSLLDDYSRRRALTKLGSYTDNVGYPEWLFDRRTLDSIYGLDIKCEKKMLFECIVHLSSSFVKRRFNLLDEPVNKTIESWSFNPTIINAAYDPTFNSITISAAIINAFFGCENPRQLNYAKLGMIIGHELTHGFDTFGSQFDENGNFNSIFDVQTQQKVVQKEKCFINEYGRFCESGYCVNGTITLGENTADNGGMREVHRAYDICNKHEGQSKRLPYVSQYTPDQIFYISFATLWCQRVRPEYLSYIFDDVHSPGKYRINGVVVNYQPFADAFKCPPNSPMNPRDKCILW